VDKPLKSVTHG